MTKINKVYHQTVFAKEAVDLLDINKKQIYVDSTIGGGGHSKEIIRQKGFVFGIDWDQEAIDYSRKRLTKFCKSIGEKPEDCFSLKKGNFAHLDKLYQLKKRPAGILFDLGTSLHQFKNPDRGFSFVHDAPLDMRMDRSLRFSAFDLVNRLSKGDLKYILEKYAGEKLANQIAGKIINRRKKALLRTTQELAELVKQIYIKQRVRSKIHPATKTFQALRVAVNFEWENLTDGLQKAYDLLPEKGRLVVISFQPDEDKIVKKFFSKMVLSKKADKLIKPTKVKYSELKNNPSARSAIMRAIRKVKK